MKLGTRVWLAAYRRWFDHHRAGRARRAAVWGALADATADFA